MNCIMKKCAHPASDKKASACAVLGECGCAHALERAAAPGGYLVIDGNNPTITALVGAGFVSLRSVDWTTSIATAKPKAFAFAAKQGRVQATEGEKIA